MLPATGIDIPLLLNPVTNDVKSEVGQSRPELIKEIEEEDYCSNT